MEKTILITGAAGFIGAALCERLLNETEGYRVIGLDNLNDYYDVRLKEYRLEKLKRHDGFSFVKRDICDRETLEEIFREESPDTVVHLAAQAGVRASISYPRLYIQSNIVGFFNILQACRHQKDKLEQLIFASSSSVYGDRDEEMLSTDMSTHSPSSLYAATKIADEAMGYSYSKLYGINMTGLRFFTAYGPAGRPDMAYYKFADRLCAGKKLDLYNFGKNYRDFTYVDDITDGIKRIIDAGGNKDGDVPYRIMNIGRGNTVVLDDFVRILFEEMKELGLIDSKLLLEDCINYLPAQQGDVVRTLRDIGPMREKYGYRPKTDLREGLREFLKWYKEYNSY